MSISGVTNIAFTTGQETDPLADLINAKFSNISAEHVVGGGSTPYLHIKDSDNHTLITLTLYNGAGSVYMEIFNHSGNAVTYSLAGGNNILWSVYTCTNGLLLRAVNASAYEFWCYVTINENGDVIYGASPSTATASSPTEFKTLVWGLSAYTTTATSREAGCTSLANLIHNGGYGELSVAEYAYFALYNQYPHTIGVLNLGDNLYISNGWFVIKD